MQVPIVIVHLNAPGYNGYVTHCLEITCYYNPDRPIYLITADDIVREHMDTLNIKNLIVIVLKRDIVDATIKKIDKIMYRDSLLNSAKFELTCYARHHLIKYLFDTNLISDTISSYYFCDSDAALCTNIEDIFTKPIKAGEVHALHAHSTHLSYWHKESLNTYCSMSNMKMYFSYARERAIHCCDMYYLEWCIVNDILQYKGLEPAEINSTAYLDTLGCFLFTNALFASVDNGKYSNPEYRDAIMQYPSGSLWRDQQLLSDFADKTFQSKVFSIEKSNNDKPHLAVNLNYIRHSMEKCSKDWAEPNVADFLALNYIPSLAKIDRDTIKVDFIHFQSRWKYLAHNFNAYWKEKISEPSG